jgi:uncharacterized protein (DUF1015 family)
LSLIKPFRALRPAPGRAADVLAPPYDVLSSVEARDRVKGKPWSFLHVSKAEIGLDPSIDPYDSAVYAKAGENLRRMIAAGVLVRDDKPCYYAYRLTWRDHVETGFAAVASIAAYAENRIRKHELTTLAKEDDRVRQIKAVDAQTGPVMLAYPEAPGIDSLLARAAAEKPAVDVTADDGVRHQLWVIDDEATIAALTRAVDALPALYIADGHHRSAAAMRVAQARDKEDGYFLAVLLPQQQMTILDYNRVSRDLNGLTPQEVLREIGCRYAIEPSDQPVRPARTDEVGMVLGGRWYRLALRPEVAAERAQSSDPIARLPDAACQICHRAGFRHFRSASRQAHRLRRRRPRPRRTGAARYFGGDGRRFRGLSHADARPRGGRRRRPDYAAEIDVVRTKAR